MRNAVEASPSQTIKIRHIFKANHPKVIFFRNKKIININRCTSFDMEIFAMKEKFTNLYSSSKFIAKLLPEALRA